MQNIQAGVHIVTLTDQRCYSLDSLNKNPLNLVVSLVNMMRANEESEMKSRRIRASFDVRRDRRRFGGQAAIACGCGCVSLAGWNFCP
jgi:DNA invertase Pin-like site-specific DNA recombinase